MGKKRGYKSPGRKQATREKRWNKIKSLGRVGRNYVEDNRTTEDLEGMGPDNEDAKGDKMHNRDKIIKIADLYGYDEQSLQTVEELAELTKAISKLRRAKKTGIKKLIKKHRKKVLEEIGDVSIMVQQLAYLLGSVDEVKNVIENKLDRQIRRMEEAGLMTKEAT